MLFGKFCLLNCLWLCVSLKRVLYIHAQLCQFRYLLNTNDIYFIFVYVDFEAFDRLEILDLSWNGFIGNLPHSLRALSSLKSLSFSSNYLTGSLPTQGKYFIKILCKDVFLC